MALTTDVTRVIITDDTPMALALEFKTHANVILNDVALIQQNMHSSGPHILLAHAIELLLKGYLKGAVALKPRPKEEDHGHDIDRLLEEAKKEGLKLSDPDTDELVMRLAAAIKDAQLRYAFPFQDLPPPMDGLRVARALSNDISVIVKPETPEKIMARRAAEKKKLEEQKKRKIPFPDSKT
jgi:hypothetical protein